jgi:hypothetical protein
MAGIRKLDNYEPGPRARRGADFTFLMDGEYWEIPRGATGPDGKTIFGPELTVRSLRGKLQRAFSEEGHGLYMEQMRNEDGTLNEDLVVVQARTKRPRTPSSGKRRRRSREAVPA